MDSLLGQQADLLKRALNASRDGYAIWKAEPNSSGEPNAFTLVYINDAGAQPTGLPAEKLYGSAMQQLIPEDECRPLSQKFQICIDTQEEQSETIEVRSGFGWMGSYKNTIIPLSKTEVLTTFHDISKDQAEAHRLQWLVNHDNLTGIGNRAYLDKLMQEALLDLENTGVPFAFAFFDIDDFKKFNDTYGHDIGDLVLREFALRLQYVLHGRDRIFRLSGDEFAAILYGVKMVEDAYNLFERISTNLKSSRVSEEIQLPLTCSAGFTIVRNPSSLAEKILGSADKSMYEAKNSGKDQCVAKMLEDSLG